MNTDKIKQVISLQREIKEENDNIIEIDMMDENVLVRPDLFKELFADKEYTVKYDIGKYFYRGEFDGVKFTANSEKPIFGFISENINS